MNLKRWLKADLSERLKTLIIIQMNTFQITSCIDQIYPDVQGELCSKHTTLLNQLHRTFKKAYPTFEPTHYVIAKGIVALLKGQQHSISMGLEQGVTIILSAAEEGEQLYIEGNVLDEELVLESSGKFISPQSSYPLSKVISSIIRLATQDINPGRMRGGVLFIHSHDKLDRFGLRDSMLIGIFMSICLINGMIEQYTEDELIRKLQQSKMLSKGFCVESYFKGYMNRSLLAVLQKPIFVEMDKKYKLLFMSLQQFSSTQPILKENHENSDISLIIQQFSQHKIDLLQLFTAIEAKQSIQNQTIKDFISQIRSSFKIKASILAGEEFCVFIVESYRYAELIGKISKKVHQYIAEKTNKIDNGELQNPFTSKSKVSNQIFSSAPSRSLAILDPTSCMWF